MRKDLDTEKNSDRHPIYKINCWSNYFKKNSTYLLLYIRDLETTVTKKIEFSETKSSK